MTLIDEPALASIARRVLAMAPDTRERYILQQAREHPENLELIERAIAEEMSIGWRATPATMAYHLDRVGAQPVPKPFENFRYSMLLGEKFVDAVEGRSPRQIWNLPAQYGKSALASQWGPTWFLDRHPERNIILAAYGDNLTRRNSLTVLRLLRQHKTLLRVELMRDQQQQDRFTTNSGGGLLATTIDGEATGFGAHGLVIDDPFKNWQDAHSENRRRHVLNQYRSVFRMRLTSDDAWVIIVMTRWHEKDLCGELYAEGLSGDGEEFELVRLAEVAEAPEPESENPAMRLPDPLGRQPGEILEPRRFGEAAVAARRLAAGPYLWAGMHLQRPAPEAGTEILRDWWQIDEALPPQFDEIITSWDMKLKDKQTGDYVVGETWGRVGSSYWLYAIQRGQWNQPTAENAIALAAVREPRTNLHVVENTGYGPELMQAIREPKDGYVVSDDMAGTLGMTTQEREQVQALRRRGVPGVVAENVVGDKRVRMRAHSGLIEAGNCKLWARLPGLAAFLEEMSAFPDGAHDDQVDACSQALKRLRHGDATVGNPGARQMPATPIARQGGSVGSAGAGIALGRVRSPDHRRL